MKHILGIHCFVLTTVYFSPPQHSFVKRARPNNVLKDLIERTKAEVRSLDHQNYKRTKILLKENQSEEVENAGENLISDDDETQTVSVTVLII